MTTLANQHTLRRNNLISARFERARPQELPQIQVSPRWLLFCLAHIPLALIIRQSANLATAHAIATFIVGFLWLSRGKPERVLLACAYVAGAEILWRMTDVHDVIFWETAKYIIIVFLFVTLLRIPNAKLRFLPLLYFALLIPSSAQTLLGYSFGEAREYFAFNLATPFTIMLAAIVFSNFNISADNIWKIVLSFVAPGLSVVTLALISLATSRVRFGWHSSFEASGGFGPNQVSTTLGLSFLLIGLMLMSLKVRIWTRMFLILLALLFVFQTALTFSRGGLFTAILAGAFAVIHLFGVPERRTQVIIFLVASALAFLFLLLPELNQLTGGFFSIRFAYLDLSGREYLIQADMNAFLDHPVWGVGPGGATIYRARYFYDLAPAAHTEFTRALGEHGIFGLFSLLLLTASGAINYFRQGNNLLVKGWILAFCAWSYGTMAHSATRLIAIAFIFALTFAEIDLSPLPVEEQEDAFFNTNLVPGTVDNVRHRRRN